MKIRCCVICGDKFKAKTNATTCSLVCRRLNKHPLRYPSGLRTCIICGNEFSVSGSKKTCSMHCASVHKKHITLCWKINNAERERETRQKWRMRNFDKVKANRRRADEKRRMGILALKALMSIEAEQQGVTQ